MCFQKIFEQPVGDVKEGGLKSRGASGFWRCPQGVAELHYIPSFSPRLSAQPTLLCALAPTCIRFMASRSWSSWCAELRASRRMSVSFISLSLSSFRSCMTVSASLSMHSEILGGKGRCLVHNSSENIFPGSSQTLCSPWLWSMSIISFVQL